MAKNLIAHRIICAKTADGSLLPKVSVLYKGRTAWFIEAIKRALVRCCGIRDIAVILGVSIGKVLKILAESHHDFKPKKKHYDCLEIDELWTFVGSKTNKKWLVYACERDSGKIAL